MYVHSYPHIKIQNIFCWYFENDKNNNYYPIYVTGLKKVGLDTRIKQIHFPPPIDRSIHGLTIDGYFTVYSSSVGFPRGLFLWPVWRPQVYASKVDIDVKNRFGSILKGLQLKMTTGEAY